MPSWLTWMCALVLGLGAAGPSACAQDAAASTPAREPRRLAVAVEGFVTVATDDRQYFNYSSYEKASTELIRLRVDASLRIAARAAILAEGRMDNGGGPSLSALYLRVRPLADVPLDIQAGRIPPVFGTYARRGYAVDNPLIGQPLVYQYLTSLRANALPASADDLLRMRGRGWVNYYPIGSPEWEPGLPVVAGDRWDTGLQLRYAGERVSVATAVTQGTLSNPQVEDDNSGKQFSFRVGYQPVLGLVLGFSGAEGDYLSHEALAAVPPSARGGSHAQQTWGADLEFSRDHWLVRSETIISRWSMPTVEQPYVSSPLRAWGAFVEVRRKLRPGLFAAGRYDHVGFSDVTGSPGYGSTTPVTTGWEAPVSRVELGAGYSLRHNLLLKASVQQNWRQGAEGPERVAAFQTLFWF